jgi:sugar lactone lactonase YvrE
MNENPCLGVATVLDRRRCTLGEGPVWDDQTNRVHWVDILENRALWIDLETSETGTRSFPSAVSAILPAQDSQWLATLEDGIYSFSFDNPALVRLANFPHQLPPIGEKAQMRGNDAAVSPWGIALCGTMPYEPDRFEGSANLYRFDGEKVEVVVSGVTISNGIGWSPDHTLMYYIDTPTRRIDQFDVDASGELSNRRAFVPIAPVTGFPDGLAVDSAGFIWVALWGGGRVQRISPDGVLSGYVEVPWENVTSCAFAGKDLDTLVITTAALDESKPGAGSTYQFQVSVPGGPTFRVTI